MKKIISLALSLVILILTFSVMPLAADGDKEIEDYAVYLDDGVHLLFNFTDDSSVCVPVAAKEMGDLKAPEGFEAVYSVSDYAAEILRDPSEPAHLKSLVRSMLGYGAAAQIYFDHNAENPVGRPVTNTDRLIEAQAPEVKVEDTARLYIGATLLLEATLTLRFYFYGTDNAVTVNGRAAEVKLGTGYSYVDVPVMPYEMRKSVTVCSADTSITYAPVNYLKNMLGSEDEDLKSLLASIYDYGMAAESYRTISSCPNHEPATVELKRVATLFSEGYESGACANCTEIATKILPRTAATVINPNDETYYYGKTPLGDLVSSDPEVHFYPTEDDPDGKSLYIEYSILFNGTLDTYDMDGEPLYITSPIFSNATTNSSVVSVMSLYPNDKDSCPAGAFELDRAENIIYYENDVVGIKTKGGRSYYAINDLYGWHRIGYEITQTAEPDSDGTGVVYHIYITIYVDGVKAIRADVTDILVAAHYLYTARVEDGELVYADNKQMQKKAVSPFVLYNANPDVYLPVADVYVSSGNGFVVDAMPATSPVTEDFAQDGMTVKDARIHFTVKD